MKQFILSEKEARALVEELKRNWITLDNQQVIYSLLTRLEEELNK